LGATQQSLSAAFSSGSAFPCLRKNCGGGATKCHNADFVTHATASWSFPKMNGIIYLVGLVVVVLAILSFFGLR
jgi:hypothetical protein